MAISKEKELKRGHMLTKLEGESNYYVDGLDGKLVFRKTINKRAVKIYTPYEKDKIKKAKTYVDQQLVEKFSTTPAKDKREKSGITNPSVKELYDECVARRSDKRSESTKKIYGISWEHGMSGFWDKKTLTDFTQQGIDNYEGWYLKNKSDRVFFNTMKHFRMLINYLWNEGYLKHLDRKPVLSDLDQEFLNSKNKKETVGRVYTDKEFRAMIDAPIKFEATRRRIRLGIMFGRFLGTRKMEAVSAKWSKISWSKKEIEIWSSKNKKWRMVPLPDVLLNELRSWQAENSQIKTEYIFFAPRNPKTHISSQVFDKGWTKAKQLAKISQWNVENAARFHDLRHTFASQTADEGWPVRVACDILDMSIKEYERTYTHPSKGIKASLMKKGFAKWE